MSARTKNTIRHSTGGKIPNPARLRQIQSRNAATNLDPSRRAAKQNVDIDNIPVLLASYAFESSCVAL